MKKVILFSFLLFSIIGFTQVITIDTATYDADGLVKTVLTNNSPCLSIANVSSRTGTNFGSSNGIGYFTNTNPAFPLQNGVVLTTGNVMNAPGPNNTILSDGTLGWGGDLALETALAAAGVTIASKNATVLEFDFKPFSSNFNFKFLFASEEYGTYQCLSPDAFAFLLTNKTTGITQNIAVIPSSTIPISVQTIRNSIYNPICASANPSYFGLFNDGTAAAASATNYNGQTVVMNASSTNLLITDTYHIKLVIADGNNDNQYDSAVFLGGGSFDFGQDVLGPDVTIANGTAPCNNNNINEPYTISSGLDPNLFDFVWKDVNGNPIPGGTGPNLIVNQPGTYQLTYYVQLTSCEVATNSIVIEYKTPISTPDPINLYKCNNGTVNYTFDLTTNTPIINPALTYQISYHEFQFQANAGTIPLPTNYTVPAGSLPKTVWVRIQNPASGCYYSKSFTLNLTPGPIANSPGNMEECETIAGKGTAYFNLGNPAQTNAVLGTQSSSIYGVSYHLTALDAASGANPINTTTTYNSGSTTIYVRVYVTSDPNCSNVVSFNLIVNPKPVIEDKPDQFVCVSYFLPAMTPALGNYYSGPNGTGTLYPVGHEVTIDQLIYIYYQNPTTGCNTQTDFQVTIVEQQDLTPGNVTPCDSYFLPAYPYSGTRYFANAGGPIAGNTELFPQPTGTPITTLGVTTIHVYYQSPTDPTCIIFTNFTVTISKTPTISGTYPNLFDCTSINSLQPITVDIGTANYYTLDIPTGIYTPVVLPITSDTTVYLYAENNGCRTPILNFAVVIGTGSFLDNTDSCSPYNLVAPLVGEYRTLANGGGTVIAPGLINATTKIFHYVAGALCTYNYSFTIRILKPTLTAPAPITRCESFPLPVNPEGASYYTLAGGPATPSNVLLAVGSNITTTSTIYLYKESTILAGCYNEHPWTITINQKPVLAPVAPKYIICYDFTLTNQPPVGNYFHSPGGVNPITLPYTILQTNTPTNLETIYIYAENPNDSACNSETSFIVDFDGVAIPTSLKGDKYACDTFTLPTLPINFYYYNAPGGPNGTGSIVTQQTYTTSTTSPIYIYTQTNVRQICSDESSFNIIIYNTPVLDATLPLAFNYCDSFTLPILTVGKYYNQSITNLVGRVEIPAGTIYSSILNSPAGATLPPVGTILPPNSIFVYAQSGTSTTKTCSIERQIPITLFNVTQLPDVPATCESYQLKASDLKPGENYYLNNDGTGLLASNATISNTGITNTLVTTIYIRGNAPFVPSCFDQTSFTVTIVKRPIANPVTMIEKCDTFGLNDGVFEFDLTALAIRTQVLNGQTPDANFTLTFYTSLADANNPLATPIPTPATYPNDNPIIDSVWIRVQNNTITNSCFAVTELRLKVNLLPNPQLDPEYFICKDHETGTLFNIATLNTGLSNPNFTYAWTLNGATYGGNTSAITTNQIGTYTVTVVDTSTTLNCPKTLTTKVTLYEPYISFDYSDAFENPTYITVNVLGAGSGNYEYQLDNGPYQSSPVFSNVTPGEHTISVKDNNGHCSPAAVKAIIINYPRFFTPNGDGYHETWNIPNLKMTNPNAPIFIFDRFGKLIKQISPTTDGWNGTFNGQPLPATDYWFTVDYKEKGVSKIFKSHFSLKR